MHILILLLYSQIRVFILIFASMQHPAAIRLRYFDYRRILLSSLFSYYNIQADKAYMNYTDYY